MMNPQWPRGTLRAVSLHPFVCSCRLGFQLSLPPSLQLLLEGTLPFHPPSRLASPLRFEARRGVSVKG